MEISGRTGLLGLIGSPVGHSGSPAMFWNTRFRLQIFSIWYTSRKNWRCGKCF